MEELLNKLIERGWKPFGEKEIKDIKILKTKDKRWNFVCQIPWWISKHCTYRELVAKESWLRQYVCENKLWKDIDEEKYWHKKTPKMSELRTYDYHFEEYRLIESALKDESELEDFLLDNIKV